MNKRDGIVGQPTDRGIPVTGHRATRPRGLDQTSIHGTHQGLRSCAAPPARTHDCNWSSMQTRQKILASWGPSTHVPWGRVIAAGLDAIQEVHKIGLEVRLVRRRRHSVDAGRPILAGHSTVAYFFASAAHAFPPLFVFAQALRDGRRSRPGQGLCSAGDPGRTDVPSPLSVTSMLPPLSARRRLRQWLISGLTRSFGTCCHTLHAGRCRPTCKACFRSAGWAFAGRESNPLDRYERFQLVLTIILPSCSPDASGMRYASPPYACCKLKT